MPDVITSVSKISPILSDFTSRIAPVPVVVPTETNVGIVFMFLPKLNIFRDLIPPVALGDDVVYIAEVIPVDW